MRFSLANLVMATAFVALGTWTLLRAKSALFDFPIIWAGLFLPLGKARIGVAAGLVFGLVIDLITAAGM
jgi:hypothetical protein